MTTELKILSTIGEDRQAFLKLVPFINTETFSSFCGKVYQEIKDWYETDSKSEQVDFELIKQKLQEQEPKKYNLIEEFFTSLPSPSSADNIVRLYREQHREHLREELIIALGSKYENSIRELIDKYINYDVEEEQEEVFNAVTIEELAVQFNRENLIPLYPSVLNEAIGGGVPRQAQICVYSRPDCGKTTVAINAAVGAAGAGFKVLYIGNEDPSARMIIRFLTRFTRRSERTILTHPSIYEYAVERGYKNLYFISAHPGDPAFIRKYVEKIKPDVLIIDQIRNCYFNK